MTLAHVNHLNTQKLKPNYEELLIVIWSFVPLFPKHPLVRVGE